MAGDSGEGFGGQLTEHLPNCNGLETSIHLPAGNKSSTAEVRKDGRRYTAGIKEVNKPRRGGENVIGPVRGGASHGLTKMTGSEARGSRGGTFREGLHSPADDRLRDLDRWRHWAGGQDVWPASPG